MKKPTIKEIADYMDNQQEAILFFNYYESQGWKVGKNPMKSWKSSASGWLSRNKKRELQGKSKVDQAIANQGHKLTDRLWVRMTEIYGHKWVSSYGTAPTRPWVEVIENLDPEEIKTGLKEILNYGDSWPPPLTEFVKMCKSASEPSRPLKSNEIDPKTLPDEETIKKYRAETKTMREECLEVIHQQIGTDIDNKNSIVHAELQPSDRMKKLVKNHNRLLIAQGFAPLNYGKHWT